jgi:hypothetical protein
MSSVPGKDSRFVLSFFKPFCPSTGGRQGRVPRFWFPTGFSLARRLGLCSFRFAAAVTSLPWYAQASLPLKATQGWVLSGQSLARQARRSRFWSPGLDAPREVSRLTQDLLLSNQVLRFPHWVLLLCVCCRCFSESVLLLSYRMKRLEFY